MSEDFPPCFNCEHPMLRAIGPWIECHHCPACNAKSVTPYANPAVVVFNIATGDLEQP